MRLEDLKSLKNFNFKELNPKEVYKWPMPLQFAVGALVFAAVLILGLGYVALDEYSDLTAAKAKEEKLKKEFLDKTKMAVNLELYKKQLKQITDDSNALLKQLPNKSEVASLLIDINQSGVNRGLQFDLFRPGKENQLDYYAELPISIRVEGDYSSIGEFAADVSQLSRVVVLKDLDIKEAGGGMLGMNATAVTFRYLDDAEIEAQKKAHMKVEKRGKKLGGKK